MTVDSTEYEFENRKSVDPCDRCQWCWKDYSVGKLGRKIKGPGQKGHPWSSGYLPCGSRGAADHSGRTVQGVEIIGGQDGADPASVVYDAVAAAKARNADVLICDTAGRLHNKKTLWKSSARFTVFWKGVSGSISGNAGSSGWNHGPECALSRQDSLPRSQMLPVSFFTKLDGTAKGGIAVAIQSELDIPVKYIGVGESIDDLQKFDADAFVDALFDS